MAEEQQSVDLDNLSKEDFLEMAKYVAHVENENRKLLEELRQAKAGLMATVQQRNSLNAKLQSMLLEKANTIDVKAIKTQIVTNVDLTNPEMYRIPEGRVSVVEKSNKI